MTSVRHRMTTSAVTAGFSAQMRKDPAEDTGEKTAGEVKHLCLLPRLDAERRGKKAETKT